MSNCVSVIVNKIFSRLHARAICHSTENLDKVKFALTNALGEGEMTVSNTEGHHGNPISIVEWTTDDEEAIGGFFNRLSRADIEHLGDSLAQRTDQGCNVFVKLDKQSAYLGNIRLGSGDDVISVRIKVSAFPAKQDIAVKATKAFLGQLLATRT